MLVYEPTLKPWAFSGAEEPRRLTEFVSFLQKADPDLWKRFVKACDNMDLPYYQGLAFVIFELPEQLLNQKVPPVKDIELLTDGENLFVICRDVLLDDFTRDRFKNRCLTWVDLYQPFQKATEKLEYGDDPRQPW